MYSIPRQSHKYKNTIKILNGDLIFYVIVYLPFSRIWGDRGIKPGRAIQPSSEKHNIELSMPPHCLPRKHNQPHSGCGAYLPKLFSFRVSHSSSEWIEVDPIKIRT
jgi:hypothetical protein